MKKEEKLLSCCVHIYMLWTLLGSVFIFFRPKMGTIILFAAGGSSIHTSLWLSIMDGTTAFVQWMAVSWLAIFPVWLITAYVLACKKRYIPLCITVLLDLIPTVVLGIQSILIQRSVTFFFALADMLISAAAIAVLFYCYRKYCDNL